MKRCRNADRAFAVSLRESCWAWRLWAARRARRDRSEGESKTHDFPSLCGPDSPGGDEQAAVRRRLLFD